MGNLQSCLPCGSSSSQKPSLKGQPRSGDLAKTNSKSLELSLNHVAKLADSRDDDSGSPANSVLGGTEPFHTPRDWLPEPGGDTRQTAAWLNSLITALWPGMSKYIIDLLHNTVEPAIQKAMPPGLHKVHFKKVSPGETPFQFDAVLVREIRRDFARNHTKVHNSNTCIQFDVNYVSDLYVELDFVGARLAVSKLQLKGKLLMEFTELTQKPPFFSGLKMFFPQPPYINMDWGGVLNVLEHTMFKQNVNKVLRKQMCGMMVLPNSIPLLVDRSDGLDVFQTIHPFPAGLMRVRVVEAKRLKASDTTWMFGKEAKSDPYAILYIGGQEFQTNHKNQTLNPVWTDQVHDFIVDLPSEQAVEIIAMDHDKFTCDDLLGRAEVKVVDMLPYCDMWIDLADDEGEAQNSCLTLGSQIRLEAEFHDFVLDSATTNGLPRGSKDATCGLFIGIYSVFDVHVETPKCKTWCTVQVGSRPVDSTAKKEAREKEDETRDVLKKQQRKIMALREASVKPEVIADVLECSVADVQACVALHEGRQLARASTKVSLQEEETNFGTRPVSVDFEEAFVYVLKDVVDEVATITLHSERSKSRSTDVLGTATFEISKLLLENPNSLITRLDFAGDKNYSFAKVKLQLRALVPRHKPRSSSSDGGRSPSRIHSPH